MKNDINFDYLNVNLNMELLQKDDVNKKLSKYCQKDNCHKRPSYNLKGLKAIFCAKHKEENMIDVVHAKCGKSGCELLAWFDFPGSKSKGKFCSAHCEPGMIDIIGKKCEECDKKPSFNYSGLKEKFCFDHKKESMVNVKIKNCQSEEGCLLKACFNYEGKRGLYCEKHKKEGMINVESKRCIKQPCSKQASYNIEGQKARFCLDHKDSDMIDVRSKKCEKEDCKLQPVFDFTGKKGRFCYKHKLEGMINVKAKCCAECPSQPIYNYRGLKPVFCAIHKKDDMVDMKNKRCKTEHCETLSSKKYKGYCVRCFMFTFPDEKVSRNYRTKEKTVADFVSEKNTDIKITFDKIISGGCSRKRPDILIDFGTHVLIVEVDENQHDGYSCENKRMMEISQDLGHPHIIFIRFNPDSYYENDKKIPSCWKIDKRGICTVKDKKIWDERLLTLQNVIEKYKKNIPDKHITVEKLYFGSA